jgi:flavin-dependent dehydrogenase
MPIEGGRWLVTLAGFSRDYPPQDEAGFMAFARSIAVPELHSALCAAEPLGPAIGYRRTTSRWRRYHEAARWPDGFVALGDAVCSFNPYYGQGMAVAALSAIALGELVAGRGLSPGFAATFQSRLARLLADPWLMATTEDCRHAATVGAVRTWRTRLNLWYTDRLIERATHDPVAMNAFMSVLQLVEPYHTVMRPRVLVPALLPEPATSPGRHVGELDPTIGERRKPPNPTRRVEP